MNKTRLTVLQYSLSKKKSIRRREMRGKYYWSVFRQTMAPYTETNIPLVLVVKLSIKKPDKVYTGHSVVYHRTPAVFPASSSGIAVSRRNRPFDTDK